MILPKIFMPPETQNYQKSLVTIRRFNQSTAQTLVFLVITSATPFLSISGSPKPFIILSKVGKSKKILPLSPENTISWRQYCHIFANTTILTSLTNERKIFLKMPKSKNFMTYFVSFISSHLVKTPLIYLQKLWAPTISDLIHLILCN